MSTLCRHFGTCGGCQLQDMPQTEYLDSKRRAVADALAHHGIADAEIAAPVSCPPHTRRRAVLKVEKHGGETLIGFHARQSHDIVDMRECRLLTPPLFKAVAGLRAMMGELLREGGKAELHVTETDSGLDIALNWTRALKPALVSELARWASKLGLARITLGRETAVELAPPMVSFGTAQVKLPPMAFLQPAREGEAELQRIVCDHLSGAKKIADLFSGCGTFSFPLAAKARVHAVEQDKELLGALSDAARHAKGLKPITTERRDLFKTPLGARELAAFDGVAIDPPRAGAIAQIRELAASRIARIAYVSCNPASFARDARVLIGAGFRMSPVIPVDQFLWSPHTELVAGFVRR